MAGNTILLTKFQPIRREAINVQEATPILPGNIVKITNTGGVDLAGPVAVGTPLLIAVENDLYGKGVSDSYALNDLIQMEHLQSGDVVQVMAVAGAGFSAAVGTPLYLDASGTVSTAKGVNTLASFVALQALTIATGGNNTLIDALVC
jgi:hypothetical protein